MRRRFGDHATEIYEAGEIAAVSLIRDLLDSFGIHADTHSRGETQLAHSGRAMKHLRATAETLAKVGEEVEFLEQDQLAEHGLNGPFHGAMTTPVGFGLNPRKYLFGLTRAAQAAGAHLFQRSAVTGLSQQDDGHLLVTAKGQLRAKQVIIATNGYSSENIPQWLAGRYMPATVP